MPPIKRPVPRLVTIPHWVSTSLPWTSGMFNFCRGKVCVWVCGPITYTYQSQVHEVLFMDVQEQLIGILGWHGYKRRVKDIRIFASIHVLCQLVKPYSCPLVYQLRRDFWCFLFSCKSAHLTTPCGNGVLEMVGHWNFQDEFGVLNMLIQSFCEWMKSGGVVYNMALACPRMYFMIPECTEPPVLVQLLPLNF